MKRIITFLVLFFGVLSSLMAHDVEIDGIYYNLDATNKTAAVTFKGESYYEYADEYSGAVDIPETITYNDVNYKVSSIAVFDVTNDQGVAFVVNPNSANPVYVPLTYSNYNAEYQTAQYTGTYTITELDFTAKIGGLTNLNVINFGTNGQALEPSYLYNPTRGASNGFSIVGDYKVGDILNISAVFGSDWNVTLIVNVTKTLEPTDDAANVALEGKWHMPTQADVEELLRECTTEFGSYYGVNGYFVTSPNGNAIFLPAVGIKEGTDYEESTRGGDYWTSSLYEDNQKYAVTLSFALTYIEIDDMQRTNGLAIRPVIHKDYVGIEEVVAINVYAKDHTIYCEEPFQIYTVTGLEVTHLNGALEGVYIVKTEKGNKLISVW